MCGRHVHVDASHGLRRRDGIALRGRHLRPRRSQLPRLPLTLSK